MHPEDWSFCVARFKKETRKHYGRMIIDLRPGVADKDRVQTDDDFPQVPMTMMEQDKIVIQHGEVRGILDMNVDNLKSILPFESGSQLDTNSQKYMLVPESLNQQKMKIDTCDVL